MSIKLGKVIKDEAFLRELIRKTQSLRKQAGLMVHDQISLNIETDKTSEQVLSRKRDELMKGTGSRNIKFIIVKNARGELAFENRKVRIGFKKA
jgi:hypothetical protein